MLSPFSKICDKRNIWIDWVQKRWTIRCRRKKRKKLTWFLNTINRTTVHVFSDYLEDWIVKWHQYLDRRHLTNLHSNLWPFLTHEYWLCVKFMCSSQCLDICLARLFQQATQIFKLTLRAISYKTSFIDCAEKQALSTYILKQKETVFYFIKPYFFSAVFSTCLFKLKKKLLSSF